jgi:predicted O-methyltransferase YrrM
MLKTLQKIYDTGLIENPQGVYEQCNGHTSRGQGLFLQELFDAIKPKKTLEVGLANGISAMFILEKHRLANNEPRSHLAIEPTPWGGNAEHNIRKENLSEFLEVIYKKSDAALAQLFLENRRIQFAYVDTTKQFDVVFVDFYLLDKILEVDGIIVFDDCELPGISKVCRFIHSLPNYRVFRTYGPTQLTIEKKIVGVILQFALRMLPFKKIFYPSIQFKSSLELGLGFNCIAFQKTGPDERRWDWDIQS